jgi:hypothetical protein
MSANRDLRPCRFIREPLLGQLVDRRGRSREDEPQFRESRPRESGLRDRMIGAHQADVSIIDDVDARKILVGHADGADRQVDLTRAHRTHQALRDKRNDVDADERRDARQLGYQPGQQIDLGDIGHRDPEGPLGRARIEHDAALQGAVQQFERLIERLVQPDGGIRRKHAVRHSDEQRIAEPLPQSPQRMADGRLGQAEALARGREAAKIPDREKDAQQVEVERAINLAHTKNYNYEFDLEQADRHRAAMDTRFDTAPTCAPWLQGDVE